MLQDPGNLESDLQVGANAGYTLLWVLLWCTVLVRVFLVLLSSFSLFWCGSVHAEGFDSSSAHVYLIVCQHSKGQPALPCLQLRISVVVVSKCACL